MFQSKIIRRGDFGCKTSHLIVHFHNPHAQLCLLCPKSLCQAFSYERHKLSDWNCSCPFTRRAGPTIVPIFKKFFISFSSKLFSIPQTKWPGQGPPSWHSTTQFDLHDHIISSSSSIKALASWSARLVQEWKKVPTSLMLLTRRATWGEKNARGTNHMNLGNSSKFF